MSEDRACLVQVDLDSSYAYKASLSGSRESRPEEDPVYTLGIPRILALLDALGLRATFFVVGQDVGFDAHARSLAAILEAGHELANHGQRHLLGLSKADDDTVAREILEAHEALDRGVGVEAVGFRTPGWDVSAGILERLAQAGYRYDSSICPTWLGGAPARPYFPNLHKPWRRGVQRELVEIPAGVMPWTRVPYSATMQMVTGDFMLERSVRSFGPTPLAYTFHGIDLVDPSEVDPVLGQHPAIRLPLERKQAALRRILGVISSGRRSITTAAAAEEFHSAARTPDVSP